MMTGMSAHTPADLGGLVSREVVMPASIGRREPTLQERYDVLLGKLALADRELADGKTAGRGGSLEEASGVVFDLLYALDFRGGGEIVSRLAALYGYIGNQLLNIGKTADRAQLAEIRAMIATLRDSVIGENAD